LVLALLLAGCVTVTRMPEAIDADRSGVPLAELVQGRALFVSHCGSCHQVPDPGSRSAAEWSTVVPQMLEDAKLSAEDGARVLTFLKALAKPSAALPEAHAERR
jgi:mono/diheme cytochrome c family protein